MAAGTRIVDISEDAVVARRRRRRALLRLGVPILGIVLVIAAILAIALYSEEFGTLFHLQRDESGRVTGFHRERNDGTPMKGDRRGR